MKRKTNTMLQATVLLLALLAVLSEVYGADFSSGYNRFRPLDQSEGDYRQRQSEAPGFGYDSRGLNTPPGSYSGYQPQVSPSLQMQPRYKFRELKEQTGRTARQPSFRPDARLDPKEADNTRNRPKRWTGNDVYAPASPSYTQPPQTDMGHWQQTPGYPYSPMTAPPVPQYYAPENRSGFPWPGGFMPSFSW